MVEWRSVSASDSDVDALWYEPRQLLALSSIVGRIESISVPASDGDTFRYDSLQLLALSIIDGRMESIPAQASDMDALRYKARRQLGYRASMVVSRVTRRRRRQNSATSK